MRRVLLLLMLAGCHKMFSLVEVEDFVPLADAPLAQVIGCADRTREDLSDITAYPAIAACSGAWDIPGALDPPVMCNREAGNTGAHPDGMGCSASDVCAEGWEVCRTPQDVGLRLGNNAPPCSTLLTGAQPQFFMTGTGGVGTDCLVKPEDGANDIFGCGNGLGGPIDTMQCQPLDTTSGEQCSFLGGAGGWDCIVEFGLVERDVVVKRQPLAGGGVLCCRVVP